MFCYVRVFILLFALIKFQSVTYNLIKCNTNGIKKCLLLHKGQRNYVVPVSFPSSLLLPVLHFLFFQGHFLFPVSELEDELDADFATLESLKKEIDEMNEMMEKNINSIADSVNFFRTCQT